MTMPGLSASALDVEPWWGRRPPRLWTARRLYDYAHLPEARDRRGPPVAAARPRERPGPPTTNRSWPMSHRWHGWTRR
ncbi:DUF6098 family protein [Streptomyces virginiae]|uniref:DUF6098 family protein n=1 Tax=Streptomyces virginiae TaxID=1961 RepID=UPI00362BD10F